LKHIVAKYNTAPFILSRVVFTYEIHVYLLAVSRTTCSWSFLFKFITNRKGDSFF